MGYYSAQLANTMTMDRATVGHNLGPLERDGWVEIKVSPTDRRMREVRITGRGLEVLLAAYPAWRRARDGFEQALGAREVEGLRELMARVIDAPLPDVPGRPVADACLRAPSPPWSGGV